MYRQTPLIKKQIEMARRKAIFLHKQGFALREIGNMVGMSHEWVRHAVDMSKNNTERPVNTTP